MLKLLLNCIPADCDGHRARSRILGEVKLLLLAELPLAALRCSREDILVRLARLRPQGLPD